MRSTDTALTAGPQTPWSRKKCSLAVLFLLLISCAKVGDPLPPLVRIPGPVDVELVQQARSRIEVLISSPVDDIEEVELYRECGTSHSAEFSGTLLTQVKIEKLAKDTSADKLILEDPEPVFNEPCRYQVRVRNDQGRRSVSSATVETVLIPPPGAPTNLKVEVREQEIVVSWDPPSTNLDGKAAAEVSGYLVNSIHAVQDNCFIDRQFTFGKPVIYSVQTIGRYEPMVLSQPSERVRIVPLDRFPPAAPTNLTAVPLDSKVQLLWDAVVDSDLAGYFIYRGIAPEAMKKTSPLVPINRYIDSAPQIGSVSHYAVTAVDNNGNESVLSDSVAVTVDQ